MKLYLNGDWSFKQHTKNNIMPAIVPGCNFLDLMENGIIVDPFVGANEKLVQWVSNEDWVYFKQFEITKQHLAFDNVTLIFKQIDTVADIILNGQKIKFVENCHIGYEIDIKNLIKEGKNNLEVYFYSPVNYVIERQKKEKCPSNANGLTGIPHIRKPQCHFGWDWGPILPLSGITGDVYIEFKNFAKITEVKIKQVHNESVGVFIEVNSKKLQSVDISTLVEIIDPNGITINQIKNIDKKGQFYAEIKTPQLWQPNGLTDRKEQPLYTVVTKLYHGDKVVDVDEKKIGLRTIELNRNKDKFGENFQFIVNGNAVFAKGANWIPADSFITRLTNDKLENLIKSAVDSSFNMIRVWGGGYYENDLFYDLCDKYGLLVWQDFAFACQPYPFFIDDFQNNVAKEVEYNIKRLRHRASLCLWCGNNEIEIMSMAWRGRVKYIKWTEKYFYNILPKLVKQFDDITPYIAGTPIGSFHNKKVSSDKVGDTHLWAVWHGLQNLKYYRTRYTRFCSEFGFESLPDIKTIEKFAQKADYALDSEVFLAHQKCASGNKKIQYYIASKYRLPNRFEDYIYLSQICQAECIKDATEHWHRNMGRCNGSLYWQYNDCWPVASWAGIDYYQNYKALHYETKQFFNPISISIEDTKKHVNIYAINDTLSNKNIAIKVRLVSFEGKEHMLENKTFVLSSITSRHCLTYKVKDLKKLVNLKECVLIAELFIENKLINKKTLLFDNEKNILLPQANIKVNVVKKNSTAYYKIISDKFVRKLCISSSVANSPFSENFFDLLPNEEITITQEVGDLSTDDIIKNYSLFDISKVVPQNSKFGDWLIKAKIFLIPINFFSYIYYKWLI